MRIRLLALLVAALLVAGCGSSSSSSSSSSSASAGQSSASSQPGVTPGSASDPVGFEGVPLEIGPDLAANTTQTATVDGISCGPTEQLAYHIHAHLAVYVDGKLVALPAGVGIPGSQPENTSEGPVAAGGQCIYWLHTHAPDGIIHVESPTNRVYTLGNFFDVWQEPLSGNQVGLAKGKVTAFVNGKRWTSDPHNIPLLPHAVIQLDVGSPTVPFQSMSWDGLDL
jgi:hypothetical protein